ncbi:unnamed protein product [Closterium sp. Yama58-4]|nr:unnamed protein product [Closterium sp. Yama58-4]
MDSSNARIDGIDLTSLLEDPEIDDGAAGDDSASADGDFASAGSSRPRNVTAFMSRAATVSTPASVVSLPSVTSRASVTSTADDGDDDSSLSGTPTRSDSNSRRRSFTIERRGSTDVAPAAAPPAARDDTASPTARSLFSYHSPLHAGGGARNGIPSRLPIDVTPPNSGFLGRIGADAHSHVQPKLSHSSQSVSEHSHNQPPQMHSSRSDSAVAALASYGRGKYAVQSGGSSFGSTCSDGGVAIATSASAVATASTAAATGGFSSVQKFQPGVVFSSPMHLHHQEAASESPQGESSGSPGSSSVVSSGSFSGASPDSSDPVTMIPRHSSLTAISNSSAAFAARHARSNTGSPRTIFRYVLQPGQAPPKSISQIERSGQAASSAASNGGGALVRENEKAPLEGGRGESAWAPVMAPAERTQDKVRVRAGANPAAVEAYLKMKAQRAGRR